MRYRPRIEGLFARIERWQHQDTGDVHWRSITKDNITSVYGKDRNSRIVDPQDSARIFEWLLCESYDDKGNAIVYEYKQENSDDVDISFPQEKNRLAYARSYANQYLKRIFYGNRNPYQRNEWLFQVVFDYGEHDLNNPTPVKEGAWHHRADAFSNFRAGFEIRTQRLCQRVLMFHRFNESGKINTSNKTWHLVRSTDFSYDENPVVTYLTSLTQTGYVKNGDETDYQKRSYPPLEFDYSRPEINEEIKVVTPENLENLPIGLDGGQYQWVDLDGEGISGILTQQATALFYKANLGEARFAPVELVATKPSVTNLQDSQQRLMDLAGNGQQDLVLLDRDLSGYYERSQNDGWQSLIPFKCIPNVNWNDPNLRFIDLNGDGHGDILITEDEVFVWYPSQAKEGFGTAEIVRKFHDEEQGAALVFADRTQSIYLADMTGDGLNDLVRIRNGEVCYWSNQGYGRFGAKVTMGTAPYFDRPELFNQNRIRLADIDGSGTTDIIYLGRETISICFNQGGNSWSQPHLLSNFPATDNLAAVQAIDLFGKGTACLVWSSPLPSYTGQQMQYIDLMGGQKPHLMISIQNNMGAETKLHYAASTKFYLKDKAAGKPWITKLPFPVQVLEKVETYDRITGNRFVSNYRYHHGYFDGEEREFRGFGFVEQEDTENYKVFQQEGGSNVLTKELHVPPILTKTWFHTGAYINREHLSNFFAKEEYYREPRHRIKPELTEEQKKSIEKEFQALLLPDTLLPQGLTQPDGSVLKYPLTAEEEREVCRALKGQILRQEVYALDDSNKSQHPYTVTESNYDIRWLQPKQDGQYAVFFTHPRQSIAYNYERNPKDPRIAHQMTLEVDVLGNVLKSVAIAYPRRTPEHPEQGQTLVTYTENRVINKPDGDNWYRIGIPIETITYEITGLPAANLYTLEEVRKQVENASNLAYELKPTAGKIEKRVIEQVRTFYRADDRANTTDPARLNLGELQSLALPCESFKLALTPGLLNSIYNSKISTGELNNLLSQEGKYVQLEGNWWIPSGRQAFDPAQFYMVSQIKDPFEQIYQTTYDIYRLLSTQTVDPLGNTVQVRNNYRTLQPEEITDPNGNRTQVVFDALGMVAGTAVKSKVEPSPQEGDSLENFEADLSQQQLNDFSQNPLSTAVSLLGNATTRIIYDLDRFITSKKPVFAATLARETHVSEGGQSKVQVSFTYSDGFGREIQQKIQAEPGLAPVRDAQGVLRCNQNQQPTDPRWVGTGRTIFNNKGKPVKQYEPFFSPTHIYEDETDLVECGVTPIIHYDPLERVIRTDLPNGSFSKIEFDAWHQTTGDENDTVLESKWYDDRGRPAPNASEPAAQETRAAWLTAKHANTPTVVHLDVLGRTFLTIADNGTDASGSEQKYETRVELDIEGNQRSVTDALKRKVMVYDYDLLGNVIHQHSMEAGERWLLNNVAGNPIRRWDSRNQTFRMSYDELQRPTHSFVTQAGDGEKLVEWLVYGETHSEVDRNLRGQLYQHYDQAGVITNEKFDFKGNLLSSSRQLATEYKQTVDWSALSTLTDLNAIADAAMSNLDTSVQGVFTSFSQYDALNRPVMMVTPHNSTTRPNAIQPSYNEANLLEKVDVWLRQSTAPTNLLNPITADLHAVTNIDYNAKGQRTLIEYGNQATTSYEYDRKTFRLTRMLTIRPQSPFNETENQSVQDLRYTYDPVGNITHIYDHSDIQNIIYFRNQRVEPSSSYEYDPLYRLVQATGREHLGQTGGKPNPPTAPDAFNKFHTRLDHPGDGKAMGNYIKRYIYDAVGNIRSMQHYQDSKPAHPSWTRKYAYNETSLLEPTKQSNRLSNTRLTGNNPVVSSYLHDAHGNMIRMPHLENHADPTAPNMHWDYKDQLQQADLGGGGTAYYVYDAAGQRTRKIVEKSPGLTEERIYLGGFEIFRKRNGTGTITLKRETLHVMDDQQRIALVETRTVDTANTDTAPAQLIRYQLGNHLGSVSLELDKQGKAISYEEYYPYGSTSYQAIKQGIETPKRYKYTGKERDEESGFTYHHARYYVPWLGRWSKTDPMGLRDGSNLYKYAHNNPVVLRDLNGSEAQYGDYITSRQMMINPLSLLHHRLNPRSTSPSLAAAGNIQFAKTEHISLLDSSLSKLNVISSGAYLRSTYLSYRPKSSSLSISTEIALDQHFSGIGAFPTNYDLRARISRVSSSSKGGKELLRFSGSAKTSFFGVEFQGQIHTNQFAQNNESYAQTAIDLLSNTNYPSALFTQAKSHASKINEGDLSFNASLKLLNRIPVTKFWGQIGKTQEVNALGLVAAPAGTLFDVTAPLLGIYRRQTGGSINLELLGGVLTVPSIENITKGENLSKSLPTYGFARAKVGIPNIHFPRIPILSPILGSGSGTLTLGAEGSISITNLLNPASTKMDFNQMMDVIHGGKFDIPTSYQLNFNISYSY